MKLQVWMLGLPFAVVFLLISALIFGNVILAVSGHNQRHAESELLEWTQGTNYEPRSCRNMDTDSNGYISCEALESGKIVQVECAAPFTLNSGCRLSRLTIQQGQ